MLEEKAFALAVKAAHLEKQSGYHERAAAMFQAMIEFNLFTPESLVSASREKSLSFFQAFWNTEIPRFGEEKAQGWAGWFAEAQTKVKRDVSEIIQDYDPSKATAEEDLERRRELAEMERLIAEKSAASAAHAADAGAAPPQFRTSKPVLVNPEQNSRFLEWLRTEDEADGSKWIPLRTIDPNTTEEELAEIDEDPDRVVLFEDVKDFLFQLSYDDLKLDLIREFVQFSGLKWPRASQTADSVERVDDLTEIFKLLEQLNFPPHCSVADSVGLAAAPQVDIPYSDVSQRLRYALSDDIVAHGLSKSRVRLVRLALEQAATRLAVMSKNLSPFVNAVNVQRLIFEGHVAKDPQSLAAARALAKSLLKQDSANLSLWAAYAKLESLLGNEKESSKVYQTALSSLQKLPESSRESSPTIVREYAEMTLFDLSKPLDDLVGILLGLFVPAEANAANASRIVRARKAYDQFIEAIKPSFFNKGESVPAADRHADRIVCFALLEYALARSQLAGKTDFVAGQTILDRSLEVFDQALKIFFVKALHEPLQTAKLFLLTLETMRPGSSVRPSILHSSLESSLRQFPGNQFLLSVQLVVEHKNQLLGRMRLLFDELVSLKSATTPTWLFALRSETKQGAGNRVRALFERAVSQQLHHQAQQLSSSALLWKFYIDFELGQGAQGVQAAKGIFFRAIRVIPWNKSMWLYCLRKLSRHMSLSELSDIFSLMSDKEIRLRSTPPL